MPQLLSRSEEYAMRVQAAKAAKTGIAARVKRGRKGTLPASAKIDKLARVEFAPDNSRIGCESKGLQTTMDFATLAAIWVYEWHLEHPMLRPYLPVAPILPTVPYVVVRDANATGYTTSFDGSKHLDTGKYPVSGEWMAARINPASASHRTMLTYNNSTESARTEGKSWRSNRIPRNGQRPLVLPQR